MAPSKGSQPFECDLVGIVGTSHDCLVRYGVTLAQGRHIEGTCGLGGGGHAHGNSHYTVVGILAPSGSVLDRLILTDTALVALREHQYAPACGITVAGGHPPAAHAGCATHQERSPVAVRGCMVGAAGFRVRRILGAALLPAPGAYRLCVLELLQTR